MNMLYMLTATYTCINNYKRNMIQPAIKVSLNSGSRVLSVIFIHLLYFYPFKESWSHVSFRNHTFST